MRVPILCSDADDIWQLCLWQTDAVVPVGRWLWWSGPGMDEWAQKFLLVVVGDDEDGGRLGPFSPCGVYRSWRFFIFAFFKKILYRNIFLVLGFTVLYLCRPVGGR